MIRKQELPHKDKVKVIFEIPGTIWAERINLVGDFNHEVNHILEKRRHYRKKKKIVRPCLKQKTILNATSREAIYR